MPEVGPQITAGVRYIARQQRPDGGFDGHASADTQTFSKPRAHPTIFFTALISQCCSELKQGRPIAQKATAFLLSHKSPAWSWNYWQRDEVGQRMRGYPDDLDDTACALTAIISYDQSLLDGTVLGHIGRQLVAAETEVGGPYQTWLVPSAALNTWHDVDVAVNANIAGLLNRAGAMPPGLEAYLHESLRANRLDSSYYLGTIPTLYFLARTGKRSYTRLLQAKIKLELQKPPSIRNPLMNALLLAAACRTHCPKQQLKSVVTALLAKRAANHWPAYALYVEPPIDGTAYYAGSAALTTAFACEALSLYDKLSVDHPAPAIKQPPQAPIAWRQAQKFSATISQPLIKLQYTAALGAIAERDTDSQISAMAQRFSRDLGWKISPATLTHLDIASINGWIAYTIYDDVLDGEVSPVQLGTANLALRQCVEQFRLALPDSGAFQQAVAATLLTVDEANTWEISQARATVTINTVIISKLPAYNEFAQLAERSWGHVLASTGTLMAAGYTLTGAQVRAWQLFFHHFLIARQLNDDAHDWSEDLAAGRLSAVICLLLEDLQLPYTLDVPQDMVGLRRRFWETTAPEVCARVDFHLAAAETALQGCRFLVRPERYQQWLARLSAAVAETRHNREEALAFIASFGTT